MFFAAVSYLRTVRTWAEEINSKASYRNTLNIQNRQDQKNKKNKIKRSGSNKRCNLWPTCPQVGNQPRGLHKPQGILDPLQAAMPSPASPLHSSLTDLPSSRIQCCNHILLCGHNQLLGSRGKFQGGKLEFPDILLSPKGKSTGRGPNHHCTERSGKRQLHKYMRVSPS